MTSQNSSSSGFAAIQQFRERLEDLKQQVSERHFAGGSGIDICNWFSDQLDDLLRDMISRSMQEQNQSAENSFCVICVGGNGRRRPTPYSDVDLLLVASSREIQSLEPVLSAFVRDCWDTGFQLGHSLRTPDDVIRFASEDIQFATSLVDMRHLLGSEKLFRSVHRQVEKKVFRDSVDRFVDTCVASRREEWMAGGDSVNQLEPDVKKSPGGLRDLHLINWVTHARYGDSHVSSLLEHNAIRTQELALLASADEFLTSLRLELHCRTNQKQDVLTRDLQLEISRARGAEFEDHRKTVETFMQEYFAQTSRVAELARRVTETEARPTLMSRLKRAILPSRTPRGFEINDGTLSVTDEYMKAMRLKPENLMEVFEVAAEQQVLVAARLRKAIGKLVARLPEEPSQKACRRFRHILRSGDGLPVTLRAMFETKTLDWLVPAFSEVRYLMQFNQYHSFTVDEHTLKTIDEVVGFLDDNGPLGTAYDSVRHKATLHLSLILHDIGKGRDGDHSIIGEGIAEETAIRLQTPENKKRMMMFLVRQHLVMPDLAFRRDISDQALLMDFARLVGAPELLRMLYVLSAADIRAVGPDVWTDWKGDLLADLYNRTMLILGGRPIKHLERDRLELMRQHVRSSIAPIEPTAGDNPHRSDWPEWIDRQLDSMPAFYLMMEDPERVARDLDLIQKMEQASVRIEGEYDEETDTVSYRVFATKEYENGAFHKIAGVLSGLRMDILAAQSSTNDDSVMIAAVKVTDNDFAGAVPSHRIDEVREALQEVLTGEKTVDHIFRRSGLFRLKKKSESIQLIEPHVSIDNDCSESYTVVDVFAMDNPGLLYTLALTLYEHNLSVELTRIATNIDQVVDVFYVVDADGRKVEAPDRIQELTDSLMYELRELQQDSSPA
ncbi:MAG: [protein-PII] uridylyltransferase [Planctomycetaceae bacterium]|nr:[protein-PII] uridylyltransferase [Planctomycetaceae bacterium]